MGTIQVAETSEEEMAKLMVGREVDFGVEKQAQQPGKVVLEIEHLKVKNSKGLLGVKDFTLQVRAGEIVGVAGIDGNGQTELVYALTGLAKAEGGKVLLNGKDITHSSIKHRIEAGMGHIPEDRHKHGLILDFKLKENMVIHSYNEAPYAKNGLLQMAAIDKKTDELIEMFDVRSGQGRETITRSMSGGNQQKAIIAREIDRSPELLIVVQPTRGLDVGAIENIHKNLLRQRDAGKAVLLVSFDLEEVMNISDRIIVFYEGEIVADVRPEEVTVNELGLYMSGSKRKGAVK